MEISILIILTLGSALLGKTGSAKPAGRYGAVALLTLAQLAYMLYVVFTMEPPPLRF